MTEGKKKYIIQIAEALDKGVDSVYMAQQIGQEEKAASMLVQMQQMAIEIGTTIEQYEGQDHFIVKMLERLCENIYEVSNSLGQLVILDKYCKHIKSKISKIISEIRDEILVKREILFLPYQVSMWDSLESVWMAANEDSETDCYVVPIPYYDVLPDNSLGKLHYDGDRYPDYVPITGYWEYKIEERMPDIIFFHNPYDDLNTVTRVPEEYYSNHLKLCTNLLVYIPYLLSEDDGPAEHQCYTPGVLFADRVIVQPGNIYKKYCNIYTKTLEENNWTNKLANAKKKFLPLGSPKMDKIWNEKCELEDLPEDWRTRIQNKDGSRKKIVIYNITIIDLLWQNEKKLDKLDCVFQEFRKRKDEIVMIWRPHPLFLNTINAMRPQLRDGYLRRVQEFKEQGFGIFDETPDPNLAIALADAYYGDSSSLMIPWQETGKPLLLQNTEIIDYLYGECLNGTENNNIANINIEETYCKNIKSEDGFFEYSLPIYLECIMKYQIKKKAEQKENIGKLVYKEVKAIV